MPAIDTPLDPTRGPDGATHFELWPHRATGPAGLRLVVGSTGAVMLTIAAVPAFYGLWPVSLIVVAAYVFFVTAFLHNRRAGCYGEIIDITPHAIVVQAQCRRGGPISRTSFDPHWVRVCLATDYYVENRLTLRQSGRAMEIGRFLAPEERVALARALDDSLRGLR